MDREQAQEALSWVDLAEFADRSVLSLSGGELQRVFLAQALVQEASVLLLDEPMAHLDVHHQFDFLDRVFALAREGRTVITVFHDLELAARYSDDLIVVSRGTVVASGSPPAVLNEALIASVFRMDAQVSHSEGIVRIQYRAPTRAHSASSL